MLENNHDACYAAFCSKDPRFDGHFFVGVTSTGIYCRPVCHARLPKPENCVFFATAAEAESAGFRPCLQCRPELAPGFAPVDASDTLAWRAARLLEEDCGSVESIEELAERLGCTSRHLRRVFVEELRVSPVEYLRTCRLLLAKNLLTNTKLSVLEVAMASGFGSLRRFNDAFQKQYRLSPSALRKQTPGNARQTGGQITLPLGYRPPYGWERLLDFFALRAIPGVEVVRDGVYSRTVRAAKGDKELTGWFGVGNAPGRSALEVTVSASLLPVLSSVLARIKHLFDLSCDPAAIAGALDSLNDIRPELCVAGTRLPGCFDPFEMSVRAVLGQQITVKAATTLSGRLAQTLGVPVQTDLPGLTRIFPSPRDILALGGEAVSALGALGVISARSRTICALAGALEDGSLSLAPGAPPEPVFERLTAIPGIGPWTASYIAMRTLGWTDAFPETDYGIKKALAPRSRQEILALAERWRPWRAYAAINLWNSL